MVVIKRKLGIICNNQFCTSNFKFLSIEIFQKMIYNKYKSKKVKVCEVIKSEIIRHNRRIY